MISGSPEADLRRRWLLSLERPGDTYLLDLGVSRGALLPRSDALPDAPRATLMRGLLAAFTGASRLVLSSEGAGEEFADDVEPGAPDLLTSHPAVFLRTGGSTGAPRTWSKTPENLLREAFDIVDGFGFQPSDKVLSTVPSWHLYGLLFATLAPWCAGAQAIAAEPYFPAEVQETGHRHGATVLVASPVHYRSFRGHFAGWPELRLAFSSGGPLDAGDADAFRDATGVSIREIFGSTETGGIATRSQAAGKLMWMALPAVQLRVDGERLAVRSPYLSPELPRGRDGFFLTSDRVRREGEGFELLGRQDGIVKVGGKRVDLAAIEQRIAEMPGVREVAVFARGTSAARFSEVLAVVAGETGEGAVTEWLRLRLAPEERPREVRVVRELPRSAVGKLDRVALEGLFG